MAQHTPETIEYGITSFIFRSKWPFHPDRLHTALSSRPRTGALAGLLRLKGFAWLATRPTQQAHVALAGTQFVMAPGSPWMTAIPQEHWPAEAFMVRRIPSAPIRTVPSSSPSTPTLSSDPLLFASQEMQADLAAAKEDPTGHHAWDPVWGDRRIELVCIGRDLDEQAAHAQLQACLLTDDEMREMQATIYLSVLGLPDPFRASWDAMQGGGGGGGAAAGDGQHGAQPVKQELPTGLPVDGPAVAAHDHQSKNGGGGSGREGKARCMVQ